MIEAARALGIPRDRFVLLARGVDIESYRPNRDTAELRARLGLARATPVILSPRYQVDEPLYNLDIVLEAFVALKARFPDVVCVQLYDPARERGRSTLEQLAASRGVADSYRLVPMAGNDAMPLFYNLAEVFVSVPSSDGFPVTVLEASACAAPLAVSDLPYCKEWFVHGENGLLVPPRDAKALEDAIAVLCGSPDLRRRFGMAGRRLVEERADYQRCMDTLEALYFQLREDGARLGQRNN
jgi:glycosyltransferase involved in cell wall biosynthesis